MTRYFSHVAPLVNGSLEPESTRLSGWAAALSARSMVFATAFGACLTFGCASVSKHQLVTHSSSGLAERAVIDPELDPARLEERGAVIGDILIVTQDVFDPSRPGEDRAIFRVANRLHPVTRPTVVAELLTFAEGDPFRQRDLAESERVLRATRYLYDARIRPVRIRDGKVDVEVLTRDMWTLKGNAAFKRSGGANETRFTIEDSNFLGTGKDFTIDHTSNIDRDSALFRYRDQTFLGSRTNFELWYGDNSDGALHRIKIERPFFALDSKWAGGFHFKSNDRVDPLYSLGKVSQRFRHQETLVDAYVGLGRAEQAVANRWRLGFTYQDHEFEPAPGFTPRAALPRDRRLAYPWIGWNLVEDRFVVERNLDRIDRSEDINLGLEANAKVGYSPGWLGAQRDSILASAGLSTGFSFGPKGLLRLEAQGAGRLDQGQSANILFGGSARYYRRVELWNSLFFAGLSGDLVNRRDPETQLLLGGDTGLRGYPLRYQDGDRRILLTLEQRFYTNWNILQLFNVGGAVFFDAGKAWFHGPASGDSLGWLKDVGVGLRFSNSRSSQATMIHLDLAFPLDRQQGIDGYQIVIRTSDTF